MIVRPDGPIPADIMIVGEAPGEEEERVGRPFVGYSGTLLDRMLHEAGITRSRCFVTNVCRERPPKNDIGAFFATTKAGRTSAHSSLRDKWVTRQILEGFDLLLREVEIVRPKIILTCGNVPFWALTGVWGITKWRGSLLYTNHPKLRPVPLIPTIHPASVLREWKQRQIVVNDLRRVARYSNGTPYPVPKWNFRIGTDYVSTITTLDQLLIRAHHAEPLRITFDLETRSGHIACAGLSWSLTEAMCIPFMVAGKPEGPWTVDEETELLLRLYRLLTHKNVQVIGQNLLYDCQYTFKHWGFVPQVTQDTMISQHAIFSDMSKGLGFLASLYCDYYVYWKDEGKDWDPKLGESQLWRYNCMDCVYTDEVASTEMGIVAKFGLENVHNFQQSMFWPVLETMKRGVRIDTKRKDTLVLEVQEEVSRREQFLLDVLGHPLNPDSPKQMHTLFYQDLKLPVQMTRATKGNPARPTLDDDALQKLVQIEPVIKPIVNAIADCRTLGKFLSNFLLRPLSEDGRMRCSYNIGGSASGKSAPKTYRLSSSEDAFGCGTNLQTIPSKSSKSIGKAAARGSIAGLGNPYLFPNIREIFIPDPGYTWIDMDLERADLFVVCWEAEDEDLKIAMRMGVDMHLLNAFTLMGKEPPAYEELIERHSEEDSCSCNGTCYWEYRAKLKHPRQFAKVFVHGTNYGGKSRTMSAHTGRTVHETERAQRIWFGAHPGIERWHLRIQQQITSKRFVENKLGYRWYILDRLDAILPEALAWIPQSTVSIVINRIWHNIHENVREAQVLLQVHDSLCIQVPTARREPLIEEIRKNASIIVPYDDPLIIPISIKHSEKSWGHC